MVINKRFFITLFLLAGLSTQLSIGYGLYLGENFVGIVQTRAIAEAVLDILREDIPLPTKSTLYPRLLPKGRFSAPQELLQNAKKAGGLETEICTETIPIPFPIQTVESSALPLGETKVESEGQDGVKTLVRAITRHEGIVVREEILSATVTKAPIPKTMIKGTLSVPSGIGTGSFSFPLDTISVSSHFGTRWQRQHAGIDLAAESGTPILAADAGTVTFSGECTGYGNLIILDHKNGFSSYYAHCSVLYAAQGATPKKGEVIAEVGNTGNSTGPHLHFEIRKEGVAQNPLDFLPFGT